MNWLRDAVRMWLGIESTEAPVSGPAGPQGPAGPRGFAGECSCDPATLDERIDARVNLVIGKAAAKAASRKPAPKAK